MMVLGRSISKADNLGEKIDYYRVKKIFGGFFQNLAKITRI